MVGGLKAPRLPHPSLLEDSWATSQAGYASAPGSKGSQVPLGQLRLHRPIACLDRVPRSREQHYTMSKTPCWCHSLTYQKQMDRNLPL